MSLPFDIENPSGKWKLAKKYKEASGICCIPGTRTLAFVQDEHIRIYHLDLDSDDVVKTQKFHSGDAEDIVIIDDTAYILAAGSHPTIYRVSNYTDPDPSIDRISLGLSQQDEPEGLCHDTGENRLLIACKGSSHRGDRTRQVYSFDLNSQLPKTDSSVFQIDSDELGLRDETFHPSGIAVHPQTRDIYLVGTKDVKMLVRCGPDGTFNYGTKLDRDRFEQPEGLAFSESGELFICSEGKSKKARIFRFSP